MNKSLKSRINNIYLYTFFSGMMFWYGIEQLFLEEIGDGVFARGATLAVFSITLLLFNIPAGAISDIWGRVRSLKIAIVMMILGLAVLTVSQNIFQYSIGAILVALFWAFDEGAKEAFVYDIMADDNQEKKYQRVLGKVYAALLIGAAAANFLSGVIADVTTLRGTYLLSFLPCFAAFYFLTKLHEPEHHKQVGKKIVKQLGDGLRAIRVHRVLLIFVVAQTLIYVTATISLEFTQPAVVEYTNSAIILGIVWGVMGLIMATGNLWAHKVTRIFSFIFVMIIMMLTYFLTSDSWLSLVPLFIFVGGMEAVSIRGEAALQENTSSHLRATISSVPGSASMLLVAGLSLWVGASTDSVATRIFAVCFPLLVIIFLMWLSVRSHIPEEAAEGLPNQAHI